MRHLKRTAKLGRTSEHRNLMLANLVCSLIQQRRVRTTLAKARAARSLAEKMVTLCKKGTVHARRLAVARLHQEDAVRVLFRDIAPTQMERHGGYTRIVKLGQRRGDTAHMAILEWVDVPYAAPEAPAPAATAEAKDESKAPTAPEPKAEEKAKPAAEGPKP